MSVSALTVNLLISFDIDRSFDVCLKHIITGPSAALFPLTARSRGSRNPARPTGPEVP